MSQKGFGPAHDRIDLTDEELRVIGRLENDLYVASNPATTRKPVLRSRLTLPAHAYYLCMRYRRRAIWLMLVAGVALGLAITTSLALATLCAAAWAIGFAALLTEIAAAGRRRPRHGGR